MGKIILDGVSRIYSGLLVDHRNEGKNPGDQYHKTANIPKLVEKTDHRFNLHRVEVVPPRKNL